MAGEFACLLRQTPVTMRAMRNHPAVICLTVILLFAGCKKSAQQPEAVTTEEIGLPFYPRSSEWGTGSSKAQEGGTASSARETEDAPEKVVAFYKKKVSKANVVTGDFGDVARRTITGQTKDGRDVEILVLKMPAQKTQVFLSVTGKK